MKLRPIEWGAPAGGGVMAESRATRGARWCLSKYGRVRGVGRSPIGGLMEFRAQSDPNPARSRSEFACECAECQPNGGKLDADSQANNAATTLRLLTGRFVVPFESNRFFS